MASLLGPAEDILLSIIETGKVSSNYNQEQAENPNLKKVTKKISYFIREFAGKLKARSLTSADAFFTKKMILIDLMVLAAILEKRLESGLIDSAVASGAEKAGMRGAAALGAGKLGMTILGGIAAIAGIGATIKQMVDDNEEKHKVAALLDSVFGGKRLSKFNKKQRLSMFRKRHRWARTNKVITQSVLTEKQIMSSEKILEEYILKNTKENFEETPFGQIVADEVNYVVNSLPEIQLAREVLGEQEAAAAGTKIAQALLVKLRQEMTALIPGLVKQEVEKLQSDLADDTQKAVASIEAGAAVA